MPRVREESAIDLFKYRIAVLKGLTDDELELFDVNERPVYASRRLRKLEKLALGEISPKTQAQTHFVEVLTSKFSNLFLYGKGLLYLDCPYEEKDEARLLGAMWEDTSKKWYVHDGVDKSLFKKWWPVTRNTEEGAGDRLNTKKNSPETPHEAAFVKYLTALLGELEKEFERSDNLEQESREQLNYIQATRLDWNQKKAKAGG